MTPGGAAILVGMSRAISGAVLAALIPAVLSACSSDSEGNDEPAASATVTVTATPDPEPLTLIAEAIESTHCFTDGPPGDLAWYGLQWKANADLDEFSFEITGGEGVTQVGSAKTVPPVNFGGRIDTGGTSTWDGHRKFVRESPFLMGENLDSADFWSPTAGQTGLVVLRLRFDPDVLATEKGGRFDGLRAIYTTQDGETGEAHVETEQIFRIGACR